MYIVNLYYAAPPSDSCIIFGFMLAMGVYLLRPFSNAKHHDNYSTVPNLYTCVRSVLGLTQFYGGGGKRKYGMTNAAPATSTAKPSDMTSGDSTGGSAGTRPCMFPLVRPEGNGEDGGARMSCTYPIDLKPRMLRNVVKYRERYMNVTRTNTLQDSFAFHLPCPWAHHRA